jgi:hypothetical protein
MKQAHGLGILRNVCQRIYIEKGRQCVPDELTWKDGEIGNHFATTHLDKNGFVP